MVCPDLWSLAVAPTAVRGKDMASPMISALEIRQAAVPGG